MQRRVCELYRPPASHVASISKCSQQRVHVIHSRITDLDIRAQLHGRVSGSTILVVGEKSRPEKTDSWEVMDDTDSFLKFELNPVLYGGSRRGTDRSVNVTITKPLLV